jgi:hypothetical protein
MNIQEYAAHKARVHSLSTAFCEMRRMYNSPISHHALAVTLRLECDQTYAELGLTNDNDDWEFYLYKAADLIDRWHRWQSALATPVTPQTPADHAALTEYLREIAR